MSLVSVPAIYDGTTIRLLEKPPVSGPYRVLVTFLESATPHDLSRFWASLGAWKDDRPVEDTMRDILNTRASRPNPPEL